MQNAIFIIDTNDISTENNLMKLKMVRS